MKKICTKCKQEKPLTEFGKRLNVKGTNIGTSYCKVCNSKNATKWSYNNLERFKKHQEKWKSKPTTRVKRNEYQHKRMQLYKDGKFYVYLLPEEYYCGQTDNPYFRKQYHKHAAKRHVDDFEVVMSFDTREDALKLEACFHKLGWLGGK